MEPAVLMPLLIRQNPIGMEIPSAQNCKNSNFCTFDRTCLLLEILACKTLAQKSVLLRGLLRQSGALQKLLRHLDLSITQIYAETGLRALGDNYIRALGGMQ